MGRYLERPGILLPVCTLVSLRSRLGHARNPYQSHLDAIAVRIKEKKLVCTHLLLLLLVLQRLPQLSAPLLLTTALDRRQQRKEEKN